MGRVTVLTCDLCGGTMKDMDGFTYDKEYCSQMIELPCENIEMDAIVALSKGDIYCKNCLNLELKKAVRKLQPIDKNIRRGDCTVSEIYIEFDKGTMTGVFAEKIHPLDAVRALRDAMDYMLAIMEDDNDESLRNLSYIDYDEGKFFAG